jgi:hypothetical protein
MKSEAARALDLTDRKSLLALQGVGRESEAESVRFYGRTVTKVGPEVKHGQRARAAERCSKKGSIRREASNVHRIVSGVGAEHAILVRRHEFRSARMPLNQGLLRPFGMLVSLRRPTRHYPSLHGAIQ